MSTHEFRLFQAAVMQAWNAIVITDADIAAGCRVLIANPAFYAMTGYSLDELRGRSLAMLQGPETDPAVIDELRACLREARFFEGTTTNYRKDGTPYTVRWNISPVHDDEGRLTHFVSVQRDISEEVRVQGENRLLARALDAASDPIVVTDAAERIIFANAAFATLTGYPAQDIAGRTAADFGPGESEDEASLHAARREALAAGGDFRATFVYRRPDGTPYHLEQSTSPIIDERGRITHYVSVGKDVTARVVREKALRRAATQDALTGLHNRRHGEQLLTKAHRKALARGKPLSVLVCDVDHFKQVNDRFGHPAGDRVLADIGRILRQSVRSGDAVIRWGGEEFVILLDNCPQPAAVELAERIRHRVEAHRDVDAGRLTLSLGLATLRPQETQQDLVARADAALYQAKGAGRNRLSFA